MLESMLRRIELNGRTRYIKLSLGRVAKRAPQHADRTILSGVISGERHPTSLANAALLCDRRSARRRQAVARITNLQSHGPPSSAISGTKTARTKASISAGSRTGPTMSWHNIAERCL